MYLYRFVINEGVQALEASPCLKKSGDESVRGRYRQF
jgi:hypothetical protein